MPPVQSLHHCTALPYYNYRRVYEDGADEIVLRVDAPCQLLGVGLCGTRAGCAAPRALVL